MAHSRTQAGMPLWVKAFIGIGIAAAIVITIIVLSGHGPGQHLGAH